MDRTKGIGSSEIAAIMGLNKWRGPIDIYMSKLGLVEPQPDNDNMWFGRELEPIVIKKYEQETGRKVTFLHPDDMPCRHGKHEWFMYSPDGLCLDDPTYPGVIEAKTTGASYRDSWGEPGTDEIPQEYLIQCQWLMEGCGAEWADVPVLFMGSRREFQIYRVNRDQELIDSLIKKAKDFWENHIIPQVPPPVDASKGWDTFFKAKWPKEEDDIIEVNDSVVGDYKYLREQLRIDTEAADLFENRIKSLLENHAGLISKWGKITWKATKPRTKVDWEKAFKSLAWDKDIDQEEIDSIICQHTTTTPGPRVFRCQWKKGGLMSNLPVANKEKAVSIMQYIQAKSKSIEELLPKYLTPERMFRIASLALSKQPLLMQCTPQSFVIALMDAAKMGLEPNGVDGALVPYGNQCQFQPMYRGLVKQAIRCGAAKKIESVLVYANDKIKFWRDPQPHIEHYPALDDEGEVVAAYSYAVLPDNSIQVEFMNRRQLDHIRKKAKSAVGPWQTDTEEMFRKTPCKRLFKYLSVSEELEYTVAVDNALETGTNRASIPFVEVPAEEAPPKKTRTQQIKEKLNGNASPESPPVDVQPEGNTNGQVEGENAVRMIEYGQIDQIEELCRLKGVAVAAALPDGVNSVMELTYDQAEQVKATLGSL